jgi:hypothetical protein
MCSDAARNSVAQRVTVKPMADLRFMAMAPRDGTMISIQFRGEEEMVLGYWSNRYSSWVADHDDGLSRSCLDAIGWLPLELEAIPLPMPLNPPDDR